MPGTTAAGGVVAATGGFLFMILSTLGTCQASTPRKTTPSTARMIFWRLALALALTATLLRSHQGVPPGAADAPAGGVSGVVAVVVVGVSPKVEVLAVVVPGAAAGGVTAPGTGASP